MAKTASMATPREQMKPRHVESSRPRWFKLRYIAVVAVLGWALYHYEFVQHPQYAALQAKEQALQTQAKDMTKEHADLEKQAQQLNNDEFIARYASEHYNLVLPGQVMFNVKH